MTLLPLALLVIALLTAGYFTYGRFVARQYRIDDARTTPAVAKDDGVDFVPTRPFYLLSQHFSAIAAAGPIVGPIAACLAFGWGPCLLWILLGVIFIGAVHDFSALVASVRHGAHSIAEIARLYLGRRAYLCLVAFIWLSLLYIITAFTDVTAQTFKGLSDELLAAPGSFSKGGAVAFASSAYLGLALVMGLVTRFLRPPMWLTTLIFVPATLGVVYLGKEFDTLLNFNITVWYIAILVYCLVASMLPMWLLQQPRGYLGGFVLYLAIGVGLAGVLFGGFSIQQPALRPAADYGTAYSKWLGDPGASPTAMLFPFLFVTIACGACSGFHGLICGGTTSKQVARESHCQPVAFGAMLLEGLVAVVALSTVMIVAKDQVAGRAPGVIYGDGLATFVTRLAAPITSLLPESRRPADAEVFRFATTFGAMAFSTFVFDTLDVSVRLGRYLITELFGATGRAAATIGVAAAAVTCAIPFVILMAAEGGSYMVFWTLFGTANQLLAALTLLGITVWLARSGRRYWYTLAPMLFVFTVTVTALTAQIVTAIRAITDWKAGSGAMLLNGVVATALFALAAVFVVEAVRSVRSGKIAAEPAPAV